MEQGAGGSSEKSKVSDFLQKGTGIYMYDSRKRHGACYPRSLEQK